MMRLAAAFCAFALLTFGVTPAASARDGHWLRAESQHFIFYGEVGDSKIREAARTLELFDAELRRLLEVSDDNVARNKLEVYLLSNPTHIRIIEPHFSPYVLGFYAPNDEQVAAFAGYRDQGLAAQEILFHEYAHHFMMQYLPGAYPAWFVEGFAEYVQTIKFEPQRVVVGDFSEGRAADVMSSWPPIVQFLALEPQHLDGPMQSHFYGESWAAVHYIEDDPTRYTQFRAYITAIRGGADPIAAFQPAFGITPQAFEIALRRYTHGGIPRGAAQLPSVDLSSLQVTPLPEAYDDLLLLVARIMNGVPQRDRAALAARVEQIAARYPNEPFAQYARARAAMLRGSNADARAVLTPLLAAAPDDAEANYLMGRSYIEDAIEAPADTDGPIAAQSRRYFAHAFHVRQYSVPTLYQYAMSFEFDDTPMPDNALDVLLTAHDLAPQVAVIAMNSAYQLMLRQRYAEAVVILHPLAYSPHLSGASTAAQHLLQRALQHQPPDAQPSPSSDGDDDADSPSDAPPDGDQTPAHPNATPPR